MEMLHRLLERVAADEPHGVIGAAIAVGAQAVDGHDPRVLQSAGDLGLDQEPLPAGGVVGMVVEDLLERHLAMQLGIQGDEDRAQPAAGVRPQHAEPLAVAGGRADRVTGGAVDVLRTALGRARAELGDGGADVGIAELGEALTGGAAGGDGGETPFHVAAVLLDVASHQGIDGGSVVGIEVAATDEVVGEGAGLVERPGLEGGHELDLVDQPVLECEQSEQQVAVGGDAGHGDAPGCEAASDPAGHGAGGRRGGASHESHYRTGFRGVHICRAGYNCPGWTEPCRPNRQSRCARRSDDTEASSTRMGASVDPTEAG